MPTTELTDDDLARRADRHSESDGRAAACAPSKGEARRLVQQGGVSVNDRKVESIDEALGCEQFTGDGVIIRKGKKVFHRVVLV